MASDSYAQLIRDQTVSILCFDQPSLELKDAGLPLIFLGHLDDDQRIRTAYCAADLTIVPSLEDNLPNMLLESMSCGTPVIAFDSGGIPDAVVHGRTGLLVPQGDIRGLGDAILDLLQDTRKRSFMSESCRKYAVEQYSLPVQASKYLQLYKELAGGKRLPVSLQKDIAIDSTSDNTANPAATLGEHTAAIYDNVLHRSLLEFAPAVTEQLRDARAAHAQHCAELEKELTPLRGFARRVNWLYRLYLLIRRGV
jgi:hypothetical protein